MEICGILNNAGLMVWEVEGPAWSELGEPEELIGPCAIVVDTLETTSPEGKCASVDVKGSWIASVCVTVELCDVFVSVVMMGAGKLMEGGVG